MLTLIAAIIGVYGMVQIKTIDDADIKLYKQITIPINELGEMVNYFQRMRVNLREVLISESTQDKQRYIARFKELSVIFDSVANSYQKTLFSDSGRKLFEITLEAKLKYVQEAQRVIDAWLTNDKFMALGIMYGDGSKANADMQKAIDNMQESKLKFAQQTADDNTATANFAFIVMTILIVLGILSSITLAFFIIKGVLRQLGADPMDVQAIANKVAEGDLSSEITIKAGDTNSLIFSMDKMSKAVKAMVQEVKSLAQAGVEGKLDKRANASLYQGD